MFSRDWDREVMRRSGSDHPPGRGNGHGSLHVTRSPSRSLYLSHRRSLPTPRAGLWSPQDHVAEGGRSPEERASHWSQIELPQQLREMVQQVNRRGGDRKLAEQMLQKVIFADQLCGSVTTLHTLRSMVRQF